MEQALKEFLAVSSGSGSGYGSGDGYGSGSGSGSGYGSGDGDGSGSGSGDGDGSGYGYGSGSGSGIASINGEAVHYIDGLATIIASLHGNYARGRILNLDLTTTPCYVVKVENSFAHGSTLREAVRDARAKAMERRPLAQRVAMFVRQHPDPDRPCDGMDLFNWHHILTGSCVAGRNAWCRDHGINPMTAKMTPREFCEATKDASGGDAIKALIREYDKKQMETTR